jgi:hypothetical protein
MNADESSYGLGYRGCNVCVLCDPAGTGNVYKDRSLAFALVHMLGKRPGGQMRKDLAIFALLVLLVVSLMVNFSQFQHRKMVENGITTETINNGVEIERLMDQPIVLREVEFVIDSNTRRFAIGEIKDDDAQPGGGRLPMIYVYSGKSRVAKVVVPPFTSEQ